MTDDVRWQRLQDLFAQACALPPSQHAAFVAQACADDADLARELGALLAQDAVAQAAGATLGRTDPAAGALAQAAADWADSSRSSLVGSRLGPWRITAHHADGGMGAVYRGERADGQYEQAVAIKLLNPALLSAEARQRLRQERQILARLAHPHIARLLDGGDTDDGLPYLVMEFIDGLPIDAWCRAHRSTVEERLRLMIQVCRAVDHAHRNLVVHRDLKPGNLLVDTLGEPRLLDFGIAKLTEATADVTASGARPLTPSHASPEQVTGAPVTTATDVYALGVLLYDLLTGRLPHADSTGNPAALARAIVETEPPRPSQAVDSAAREEAAQRRGERLTPQRLARELSGDLDNIVLMALRKEPERRYPSAAALADDLERHLAHQPVHARPDTLAYRSHKFWQRHPVALPASTAALLLALGAAALFTWQLAQERDRAVLAETRSAKAAAFVGGLLRNTSAGEAAQREVSVAQLLQQAAGRVQTELGDDPAVAARVRAGLGDALYSWGDYKAAEQELRAALADLKTLDGGTEVQRDEAELLDILAAVQHDLGALEAALQTNRQALALWQRVGDAWEQANAVGAVALGLNSLRRRLEAEPLLRQAIDQMRQARPEGHADTAWLLNNQAWTLHAMGRLDEAAPLYEQALAMQQALGAPVVEVAQTRNNLAGLHFDRGELDEAQRQWQRSLQESESVYGPGRHMSSARGLGLLALVASERGQHEQAIDLARQGRALQLRLVGDQHRWAASSLHILAHALLLGGQLDAAERELRLALRIAGQVLPPGHSSLAGLHLGLARVALRRGGSTAAAMAERELRIGLAVIDGLASPDRVPLDAIALELARLLALRGRAEEAQALAQRALQWVQQRQPASHWRRRSVQVLVDLPPFQRPAPASARLRAEALRDALRQDLGPQAPAVRELERALAD